MKTDDVRAGARVHPARAHDGLFSAVHRSLVSCDPALRVRGQLTHRSQCRLFGFANTGAIHLNKLMKFTLSDIDHVICVSHCRFAIFALLQLVFRFSASAFRLREMRAVTMAGGCVDITARRIWCCARIWIRNRCELPLRTLLPFRAFWIDPVRVVDVGQVSVIPNAVDTTKFTPQVRCRLIDPAFHPTRHDSPVFVANFAAKRRSAHQPAHQHCHSEPPCVPQGSRPRC